MITQTRKIAAERDQAVRDAAQLRSEITEVKKDKADVQRELKEIQEESNNKRKRKNQEEQHEEEPDKGTRKIRRIMFKKADERFEETKRKFNEKVIIIEL